MPKPFVDIRLEKQKLREEYKVVRRAVPLEQRADFGEKIRERVRSLWGYRESDTLLCYVSGPLEVETRPLISLALQEGKRVAVPRCVPETRIMEFYLIDSLDELSAGSFGIQEPQPQAERLLRSFERCLCIVPALALDMQGYRLGFGKGYYDRFLSHFPGSSLSLCYENSLAPKIPHGKYDKRMPLIVTERRIIRP